MCKSSSIDANCPSFVLAAELSLKFSSELTRPLDIYTHTYTPDRLGLVVRILACVGISLGISVTSTHTNEIVRTSVSPRA